MTLLSNLFDPARSSGAMRVITRPLYSWSLAGGGVPDRLLVLPPDPWVGDMGRGRWVANRMLDRHGVQVPLQFKTPHQRPHGSAADTLRAIHGFEWLRDLRSVGGDASRRLGRTLMQEWMDTNARWQEGAWDFPVTANRLSNWLMGYDFFCASADDSFLEDFYASLIRQVRHLERIDPGAVAGCDALCIIRALVFSGLCLEDGRERLDHAMGWLDHWIAHELDGEGMHISRAPAQAVQAARLLIDMRGCLVRAGVPAPTALQSAIDRIIHAIRFFRMPDGKLACFHGSQEDEAASLDALFRVSAVKIRKPPSRLAAAGFESLTRERVCVIADCGGAPAHPHDAHAHASPLAFEMSVGRDRLVVNCGTHPGDAMWADHLRATAAHSGLSVDDRNAYEICADGHMGRCARQLTAQRDLAGAGLMLTLSHDGYAPLNGLVHTRRLMLSSDGRVLEGEDYLCADAQLVRVASFAVRFHLHPRVQASLIQDGNAALLRLPSGGGWRFSRKPGGAPAVLSLESSIYCGSGTQPRKTQQLVLSGETLGEGSPIGWCFTEEA